MANSFPLPIGEMTIIHGKLFNYVPPMPKDEGDELMNKLKGCHINFSRLVYLMLSCKILSIEY